MSVLPKNLQSQFVKNVKNKKRKDTCGVMIVIKNHKIEKMI